jgi:hypothetical protein
MQELVLGLFEAFSSLIEHPYLGAKLEGPLGFPRGVGRGIGAFLCHMLAGEYTKMWQLGREFALTRCSGVGCSRIYVEGH